MSKELKRKIAILESKDLLEKERIFQEEIPGINLKYDDVNYLNIQVKDTSKLDKLFYELSDIIIEAKRIPYLIKEIRMPEYVREYSRVKSEIEHILHYKIYPEIDTKNLDSTYFTVINMNRDIQIYLEAYATIVKKYKDLLKVERTTRSANQSKSRKSRTKSVRARSANHARSHSAKTFDFGKEARIKEHRARERELYHELNALLINDKLYEVAKRNLLSNMDPRMKFEHTVAGNKINFLELTNVVHRAEEIQQELMNSYEKYEEFVRVVDDFRHYEKIPSFFKRFVKDEYMHRFAGMHKIIQILPDASYFNKIDDFVVVKEEFRLFIGKIYHYIDVLTQKVTTNEMEFIKVHNAKQKMLGKLDLSKMKVRDTIFLLCTTHGSFEYETGLKQTQAPHNMFQLLMSRPGVSNYIYTSNKEKLYKSISTNINIRKELDTEVQFVNGVLIDTARQIQTFVDDSKEVLSKRDMTHDEREYMEKTFEPMIYHTKKNSFIANRSYQFVFTTEGSMNEQGVKVVTDKDIATTFDLTEYVKFTFNHYDHIRFYLSDVLKLIERVDNIVIIDLSCAGSSKNANTTLSNFTNVQS
jgi:hypothetical protein